MELMVFYCERTSAFAFDVALDDEGYYDALVRMFDQGLKASAALPEAARPAFLKRMDEIRHISHDLGYGVYDDMGILLAKYRGED